MSYNVVKTKHTDLGCLKTNFDGVQNLFGQIPLHISSSGTSIGIEGARAAASTADAPGGFAMTKSDPKPPKKKGGYMQT